MDILNALSPVDWLRLVLALLLYLGPGYALVHCYPAQRGLDKTMRTALAIALALSFWSLLLAWSQRSGIRFTFASTSMLALLGWGVASLQWWRTNARFAQNQEKEHSNIYLFDYSFIESSLYCSCFFKNCYGACS